MRTLLLVIFWSTIACGSKTEPPKPKALLAVMAPPACTTPEQFGGSATDANDDATPLQQAIDAAIGGPGCVDLAAGTYRLAKPNNSSASIHIDGPVEIRGAGRAATALAMMGSGSNAEWRLIDIRSGAHNVYLHDLALDGAARTDTEVQTHLVHLTAATADVIGTKLERLDLNLPSIGPNAGGACVRMLGSAAARIRDTTIKDVVGVACDRSFIEFQRGIDGVLLDHVESRLVGDQALDLEPTGASGFNCSPAIQNLTARDSILRRGPAAQGAQTVTVGGDGCAVARYILLEDDVIEDGTIHIIDAWDVTLRRLHLVADGTHTEPALFARKRIERLLVVDSTLERKAGPALGNVAKLTAQSGAAPTDVTFINTQFVQGQPAAAIFDESLARLTVIGSSITHSVPVENSVSCRGILQPIGQPVLVDTTFAGPLATRVTATGLNSGPPVLVRVAGP